MSDGPIVSVTFLDVSLDSAPAIIQELTKLFLVLWAKSPYLAYFMTIMPPLLVLYLIYTWGTVRRAEKAIDENVRRARGSYQEDSKRHNRGKQK